MNKRHIANLIHLTGQRLTGYQIKSLFVDGRADWYRCDSNLELSAASGVAAIQPITITNSIGARP